MGRGAVLTDYRLIACTTAGRSPQQYSVTLEPGQLSRQPTQDTANVFVFNQLLSNIVVNMQSLSRSSETAEQRPISECTRSQRRRSAETIEQTAARLSARRDRDSQRRRSGDYFEVEGRYFPQA